MVRGKRSVVGQAQFVTLLGYESLKLIYIAFLERALDLPKLNNPVAHRLLDAVLVAWVQRCTLEQPALVVIGQALEPERFA